MALAAPEQAPNYESGGQEFESLRARQKSKKLNSPKVELAHERVEQSCFHSRANFCDHRVRRAKEDEVVFQEVNGVEQVRHDFGSAGLAAANEGFFGRPNLRELNTDRWRECPHVGSLFC